MKSTKGTVGKLHVPGPVQASKNDLRILYTMTYSVKQFAAILISVCCTGVATAQEKKVAATSAALYKEIAVQDSMMFAAFNSQDMPVFKNFFSPDLEWYQDNGGLISYDTVFMNFANNFSKEYKLTRTLEKSSFEVHPIKNYGAIEIGTHQFRHMENGREETGTFKFLMIWRQTNGKWQITRVVSYDH